MAGIGNYAILQHQVMTSLVKKFTYPNFIGKSMFPDNPITSDVAQWDIIKQNRDKATYVVPDGEANIIKRIGLQHQTSTVACLKEKKQLKGSTMAWLRKPGTEHDQYKEQAVTDELKELDSRIEFACEYARWQALSGTLTVNQANIKFVVDYGIDATHKPTAGTVWSNVAADIVANLTTWKKLIQEDSGETAKTCYVNSTCMQYMINNTGIKALMGEQLKTQILQSGYITQVMGLNFVVYDVGYVPDGGSYTPFIPTNKLVMVTENGFAREDLAPSTDPKSGFAPGRFSKSWEDEDPAGIWVLVELNSLPVIEKVENIIYATIA